MTSIIPKLVVTDATILAFYKENPSLDFVTMNHILIDILKKLSTNLSDTISNTMNAKILSSLSDLSKEFNSFKQDMNKVTSEIIIKFHESKREYIDDVKVVLSNSSLSNAEKINNILEKNNDMLITKTSNIMNEVIPKNQEKYYAQVDSSLKNLYTTLNADTHKLVESLNKDDKSLKDYLDNIDAQFNKMILGIQQPLFSFIKSSEERTTTHIQDIRDKVSNQQAVQETLSSELNDFLNKYKYNSSLKGVISENQLYSILQQVFPSDEILNCTGETATCDYRVNRMNKSCPTILFENKDYSRSVNTEEVTKFERDLKLQKQHGIFISQNSSITFKENFQIDIVDGIIHVYIPNAHYSQDKIKIAVDIIDNLSKKLVYFNATSQEQVTIQISKEDIDELTEEYNEFTKQKTTLIEFIKTSNKHVLDKLEELQLAAIKNILIKNNAIQSDDDFKCKYCNTFTGKNKASLGAHIRNCKSNKSATGNNIVISTQTVVASSK